MTKRFAYAALLIVTAVVGVGAQQPAASAIPNISGLWNRLDSGGGGTYHGIDLMFPVAPLLPNVAA